MRTMIAGLLVVGAAMFLAACSTAPTTSADRSALRNDSDAALTDFKAQDPSLDSFLAHSYGYAVFPSIGKGAVGVGGAYGQGEVFDGNGKFIGYADMTQATVGASLGGQEYAELIVFENGKALQDFKDGQLTLDASASAVAIKAGAGASASYQKGVAVFIKPKGGLMGDASVGGQKFNFEPQ